MKKYILKIASLAVTTTALATTIACSKKSQSKDYKPKTTKIQGLQSLLAKLSNIQSSKTKSQITEILANKKIVNSFLGTTILKSMGFTPPPSFLKPGITATYTLVEDWTDSSTKLKIKVTLKRIGAVKTESKVIIIKPKLPFIDFSTEKDRFVTQKPDKTKAEISSALSGQLANTQLSDETLRQIGFKLPDAFDTTFKPTYTLQEAWTSASTKVRVKVILEKQGEKSQGKIIEITPLEIKFKPELDKFSTHYTSTTKTRKEIIDALAGKTPNLNPNLDEKTIEDLGYRNPLTSSSKFTIKYILKELPTEDSPLLKIEVILQNRGDESKGRIIEIKPHIIYFATQKDRFITQESDKTQTQINSALSGKKKGYKLTNDILDKIGFKLPKGFDTTFKTTYFLEKDWTSASTAVSAKLILEKKGDKAAAKIFTILAKEEILFTTTETFNNEVQKWQSKTSQTSDKTISEINSALSGKKKGYKLTNDILGEIGFETPANLLDSTLFTYLYTLKEDWTSSSTKVEVKVELEKDSKKYEVQTVEITPKIINFQLEWYKFTNRKSSKTEKEITDALRVKAPNLPTIEDVGYTPPTLTLGFTATYKIKKVLTDDPTVTIEVTLENKGDKDSKDIIITPIYDFTVAKQLIKDAVAIYPSKSKSDIKKIISSKIGKSLVITFETTEMHEMGYKEPTNLPDGVKIIEYRLNKDWQATDLATNITQIEITITFTWGVGSTQQIDRKNIWIKAYDFTAAKALIKNVHSSKIKIALQRDLKDKRKNDPLDKELIGYVEPRLPNGVTITKYVLEEVMKDDTDTLKVKAFLQKGTGATTKTDTQIMQIKAKPFNLADAIKLIPRRAISTKTKDQINLPIKNNNLTPDSIGYIFPINVPSDVRIEYTLRDKQSWLTDEEFLIKISFKSDEDEVARGVAIIAKYNFDEATKLIPSEGDSTKMKSQFPNPLPTRGTIININQLSDVGYTLPSLIKLASKMDKIYIVWERGWGTTNIDKNKFQIAYILRKGSREGKHVITLKAKSEFADALKKFPSEANSKMKKIQFPNPLPTPGTIIKQPRVIGYTPPPLPLPNGVQIKEYKWEKGWRVDSDDHKFSIELTLQKGDETTTKIIKIKAQRQTFIPEKKINYKMLN